MNAPDFVARTPGALRRVESLIKSHSFINAIQNLRDNSGEFDVAKKDPKAYFEQFGVSLPDTIRITFTEKEPAFEKESDRGMMVIWMKICYCIINNETGEIFNCICIDIPILIPTPSW